MKIRRRSTLDFDLHLPQGHLSISQIEMWQRCGLQYKFRYVDAKIRPPGISLIEGTNHHETLAANYSTKMKTGRDLAIKQLLEMFTERMLDGTKGLRGDQWEGEKLDNVIQRGRRMLHAHMHRVARYYRQPIAVELETPEGFQIGGVPFVVRTDLLLRGSNGNRVVDHKTCKVMGKPSKEDAAKSQQLTAEALATDTPFVEYSLLIKNGTAERCPSPRRRGKADFDSLIITVREVARAISAGSFPPCNPYRSWMCNPKWCGWYDICPVRKHTKYLYRR